HGWIAHAKGAWVTAVGAAVVHRELDHALDNRVWRWVEAGRVPALGLVDRDELAQVVVRALQERFEVDLAVQLLVDLVAQARLLAAQGQRPAEPVEQRAEVA